MEMSPPAPLPLRVFRANKDRSGLCVVLWAIVVLKELRRVGVVLDGVLSLPRGRTVFSNGVFEALSHKRLVGFLLVTAIRVAVAADRFQIFSYLCC